MRLLQDKVAIITGAGRGIGAATARLLAQHGARVVINDIDATPAEETAHLITQQGGQAIVVAGDLTESEFPEGLVRSAIDKWDTLDILVNNAGYTWDAVIHKMSDKQWEAMLAIHLTVPFRIVRAAAPFLRGAAKREKSTIARKIINISSTSGTRGNAGQANYSTGKAGIIGMTKTLAKEWGRFNIQVNAVAFGYIETRLTGDKAEGLTTSRGEQEITLGIPNQMRQMAKVMIPMGRAGTPEEAAGAVLFFASPLSNYVSGQVLEVTGGS
ncbi:MAG: SDR family NAD(P)-dependent oxidoreductase [Ardenticatenaceae bacterium]